jgi:YjbE family integral membrane protein
VTAVLDPEFWARLVGIVIIDLTLAGDNALVIALAIRTLPRRQQTLGRLWGIAGAVGLRLLFIAIATYLLAVPLLQLGGGLLLVWIALKLVRQTVHDTPGHEGARAVTSLRQAIWIIVVADAAMSLDNVIAVAAAAHGDLWLVFFGIALSLPLVVWGSGLLAVLMARHTWIIWIGGAILGWVGGEMIVQDRALHAWLPLANGWAKAVPATLAVAIGALGWRFERGGRGEVAPAVDSVEGGQERGGHRDEGDTHQHASEQHLDEGEPGPAPNDPHPSTPMAEKTGRARPGSRIPSADRLQG